MGPYMQRLPDFPRLPRTGTPAGQRARQARDQGSRIAQIPPYKRGVAGSIPAAPTKFVQLDGIFETLIGGPVTTAGNHRCVLPDGGRVPRGNGRIPFDHEGAPCAGGRRHRHGEHLAGQMRSPARSRCGSVRRSCGPGATGIRRWLVWNHRRQSRFRTTRCTPTGAAFTYGTASAKSRA